MSKKTESDAFFLRRMGLPTYIIEKVSAMSGSVLYSDLSSVSGEKNQVYMQKILDDINDVPEKSFLRQLPLIKMLKQVLEEELHEDAVYLLKIDALDDIRSCHALKAGEVEYFFQLVQLTEEDLLQFRCIHTRTIHVIQKSLEPFELCLGMTLSPEKIQYYEEKVKTKDSEPFSFRVG